MDTPKTPPCHDDIKRRIGRAYLAADLARDLITGAQRQIDTANAAIATAAEVLRELSMR